MSPTANPVDESQRLIRPATPQDTAAISFPQSGYVGAAAKFAEALSQQYESARELNMKGDMP